MWNIDQEGAYFHYCDNETFHGVEFNNFPFELMGNMPLVCDMSSNFGTRFVDWSKYAMVYAGAQQNFGPAGVCIVVVREDYIGHQRADTPTMLSWQAFRDAPNQFYNTPACYSIYVMGLNLALMKANGLQYYTKLASQKSKMLYDFIDGSEGFYSNDVDVKYRSRTNIPFRIRGDEKLECEFLK